MLCWARTEVVKAPWGQPLREMRREQEAGEKCEEEVVTVTGQSLAVTAAPSTAQQDLQARKNKIY